MPETRVEPLDLFGNFGGNGFRLRVIEYKIGRPRSFAVLHLADFFQQSPKRVRIESGIGHNAYSKKICLELLIPALSQKRSGDASSNRELPELLLQSSGGWQT